MNDQLYFLAIIPPDPLKGEIQKLKHEVKKTFHSSHALNAPPHVTIISPFRMNDKKETDLFLLLESFSDKASSFSIHLKDFSTFPPRVIFIDVIKTIELMDFQKKAEQMARSNPNLFNYNYHERPFHPHVTLAFKDLSKSKFYEAWDEFKEKTFDEQFMANSLSLLKHNGNIWEVHKQFDLTE